MKKEAGRERRKYTSLETILFRRCFWKKWPRNQELRFFLTTFLAYLCQLRGNGVAAAKHFPAEAFNFFAAAALFLQTVAIIRAPRFPSPLSLPLRPGIFKVTIRRRYRIICKIMRLCLLRDDLQQQFFFETIFPVYSVEIYVDSDASNLFVLII